MYRCVMGQNESGTQGCILAVGPHHQQQHLMCVWPAVSSLSLLFFAKKRPSWPNQNVSCLHLLLFFAEKRPSWPIQDGTYHHAVMRADMLLFCCRMRWGWARRCRC